MSRRVTKHAKGRAAEANGCLPAPAFLEALMAAMKKDPTGALMHLDLDNLHALNQSAGHDAGDKVIAAASSVLTRVAADEDWTLGRIGGDEFALLAPGLALEPAFLRADQLRRELDGAIAKVLPRGHRVTVSIGVAAAPRDAKEPNALRRKADLALHAAKEQGGDAVGLPPSEDMVLKSSYYDAAQLGRLKGLAERLKQKEAPLLREALDDLLRKYDRP